MSRTYRDAQLGAALRALDVPEHRPDFYAELHRRLAGERTARITDAREQQTRRRSRRRWGLRTALVAAVAALAFVAYDLLGSEDGPAPSIVVVENATAAEIKAQVRQALASAEALSGVLVDDGPERGDVIRSRFLVTAQGYLRLSESSALVPEQEVAYDPRRGVEREYSRHDDGTLSAGVRRGLAPGFPDPTSSQWVLPNEFGALVRVFLAARDPSVEETTYEGRPAWRLEVDAVPSGVVPEFTGNGFTITVDQGTGMPVLVKETRDGAFRREMWIEGLRVDPDVRPGSFTLDFPPDAQPNVLDHGFRRVPLDAVADAVGYAPLVPARLPEGYEPAEVTVAAGNTGAPTGVEGSNPTSTDVVSLSYRRGIDQILVTTRLRDVPGFPNWWSDPLATGEGYVDEPEQIVARRGALSGVEINLLIVARNIPHVWALTDELVVTVSGDLSRDELIGVTESLRAQR
jgi:hypothetical protein